MPPLPNIQFATVHLGELLVNYRKNMKFEVSATACIAILKIIADGLRVDTDIPSYAMTFRQLSPAIAFSAILVVLTGAAAVAQDLYYDTESCRTDPGERLFVRLAAGYEFAFPADVPTQLTSPVPDETGLPRDETEPEGCPDNPVMMNGLHLRWDASLGDPEIGPLEEGWYVFDFFIRARQGEFHDGASWSPQVRNTKALRQRISKDSPNRFIPTRLTDNLVAYRAPSLDPDLLAEDTASYLVADPGEYEEFGDLRYIVRCTGAIVRAGNQMCRVGYGLSCDLFVHYKFNIHTVPVAKALELDSQIRTFLRKTSRERYLLRPEREC